jgi:hypothetical protein
MASRIFRANDGTMWTVWLVRAEVAAVTVGVPREWLAFQNQDGTERRRLMQIEPKWDELSDERLDFLRRMGERAILSVPRPLPTPPRR